MFDLIDVIRRRDLVQLRLRLAQCSNETREQCDDALFFAIWSNNIGAVYMLVEHGFNVHAREDSALRHMASRGLTDSVRFLIKHGADVHALNDSALSAAVNNGHVETVKLLLDEGANIHANNDCSLSSAAEHGYVDVVRTLLDHGANATARSNDPLRLAFYNGYPVVMALLVERGADHTVIPELRALSREEAVMRLAAQAVAKELET